MAGKRNPWGGSSGSGDGSGDGSGGDAGDNTPGTTEPGGTEPGTSEPGGSEGPAGTGAPPAGEGGAPRGPRNPWLPGGGTGNGGGQGGSGQGDRPRRSANIEDIFRNRGPNADRRRSGGGGGGGFRLPERPDGKSWWPVVAVVVGALWVFLTSVHFVQPREQGIVTWLGGKYSHTMQPGTNFTFPWPVNMVDVEDVSGIRREAIPGTDEEKLILTADQNLVNLSYLIRWNVSDLALYRFQLVDPNDTLREVAEATMRAAVAEQDLDSILTGQGRALVEGRVRTQMQARLDAFRSGIAVQGVEIVKTDAPAQVIDAFNDVLEARQDAERDLNEARRYEQQILAQAQGEAAAFNNIYEEYRLAPDVTRRRLYYETMESVLSNTDKTIVEANGVTPFLPLPEMRRRAQATSAAPAAAATGGQ